MKKLIITSALATALIVGGGTGAYMAYAKDNTAIPGDMGQMMQRMKSGNFGDMQKMMKEGNMGQMMEQMKSGDFEEMQKLMKDGKMNFDQMKKYMKKMHPELTDQQLEDLFKKMHGTGGACSGKNGQGMMANNL